MNNSSTAQASAADDWDRYWQGTDQLDALVGSGTRDPALAAFWRTLGEQHLRDKPAALALDLACGAGAVTDSLLSVAPNAAVVCADYSHSALRVLQQRHPQCLPLVLDAAQSPLAAGSFDIVASQFGAEYAGRDAILAAAGLLRPGGVLALLVHLREGVIYEECAKNLQALNALTDAAALRHIRTVFETVFAAHRGAATLEQLKEAEAEFTPVIRLMEQLMQDGGRTVAGGLVERLYQDLAHMYPRSANYEPAEVMAWLDGITGELDAYAGRMQSMLDASQSEQAVEDLLDTLQQSGFSVQRKAVLNLAETGAAAAWQLLLQAS